MTRILGVILVLLSVVFLGLKFKGYAIEAAGIRALAMVFLTVLYVLQVKEKNIYFLLFLIFFAIADIFNFVTYLVYFDIGERSEYYYLTGNWLSIIAYSLLILKIISGLKDRKVVSKFPLQILLLLVLSVFGTYIVTDTTFSVAFVFTYARYVLEFSYNAVVMLLLSFALLNYLVKDGKKTMNLLIGSICILFSEILQLAYFYIVNLNILNVLCSVFLVMAFLFFYLQSTMKHQLMYQDSGL